MANDQMLAEPNPYAAPRSSLIREEVGPLKTRGIDPGRENPYLTIWTRPRATIRGILDTNPAHHVLLLAMLGGILQAIDRAAKRHVGDYTSIEAILTVALLLGPIFGIISLYLGGALVAWSGRVLGGAGRSAELRAAFAWGQVPALGRLPITLLQILVLGRELFTSETPELDSNSTLSLFLMATGLIETVLGVWCLVVMVKCVAEAHRFSSWRAVGAMILPVAIVGVAILGVILFAGVLLAD